MLDVQDMQGLKGFVNPLTGEDYTQDRGRARGERRHVAAHNLYLTTQEAQTQWRFLSVVLPVPPDGRETERRVERLDDLTLRVTAFGETDIISFDPGTSHAATVKIDLPAIAAAGVHE